MPSRTCLLRRTTQRCGAFVLTALFLAAAPAQAIGSREVFFKDGPNAFGISAASAANAASAGVPVIAPPAALGLTSGLVTDRNLDLGTLALGPPARVQSLWNVTHTIDNDLQRGESLPVLELFLVFAATLPNTIDVGGQPQEVSYAPSSIGLRLDDSPGHEWVIFEVLVDGGDSESFFYPAVRLGPLDPGETTTTPFAVNYIFNQPQIFQDSEGFELGIHRWQLLQVLVPIPEPTTGLLIGAGLCALAHVRRRRS